MGKFYLVLLWVLVLLCGGCAITEVLSGAGNVMAFLMIIAGLSIVVYIIGVPVEIEND